ncbi:hypothetical protein GCM10018785_55340 [Streptomyces longispororuber]|uniref:Uncharacterized protein n=1 Tax=Streptomyces longispororuber TaxID=68230 RepID=A0A919A104_9ACTN|nr:hypothetical protein [Streptomyces longispororuber]GHE80156.1 hypothetical protein GCM10018785_55340 [Streptomyces longispororuber]
MSDDLGTGKLLADDGLLARLLGKTAKGRNRPLLYGPDLPVVLLTGGPGMGKGRLLRRVRDDFGRYVPAAHVDCAAPVFRERAGQRPATRSAATEALRELAVQFGAWSGDGGAIGAPRLYAGLVAVAAGDPLASPAEGLDEVRRHDVLLPRGTFWGGVLHRAFRAYLAALGALLVAQPLATPMITAILDELFERTSAEGRAALEACYGAYSGAAGHPRLGLHALSVDFQQGGEARANAESFLFRALREDVEAAYTSVRGRLARAGRPAVLLDHADGALGRGLVRSVLLDREGGHHDRVVVVATARRADGGRFLYRSADGSGDAPAAWSPGDGGLPAWRRRPGGVPGLAAPARGVLLVRMPTLTAEQQNHELARLQGHGRDEGHQPGEHAARLRVESAVHRLSGGRPRFVTRLGEAAAALRVADPAAFTDWTLLDVPVRSRSAPDAPPRPVAELLLDDLVVRQLPEELPPEQHGHWLDLLSHLSVAHDGDCAQELLRVRQGGRDERLSAYRVAELLLDAGWPYCERHFIGDRGLRHLLMRRLYGMEARGTGLRADQELLRDCFARRAATAAAPEERADALFGTAAAHAAHHGLAAGDTEGAVDRLTRSFPARDTSRSMADWCAELLAVAWSPGRAPLTGARGARRARALGETPACGDDVLRRRVDRLLHAVWLYEDRSGPVDPAVTGTWRQLLDRLGDEPVPGIEVLTRTAGEWAERARERQPLLPCACTRHLG